MTAPRPILVVEDNPLIAMDIEEELRDHGFEVHWVTTVARARQVLDGARPVVAILDMYLRSEPTFDLAADLTALGVPFFFLSGNDASALPGHLASAVIVTKPTSTSALLDQITAATGA